MEKFIGDAVMAVFRVPAAHDAIARAEGTFGRLRRAYSSRVKATA